MNHQTEIVAERRFARGGQVRALRQRGLIPATLYGHNIASVSLQVERKTLEEIFRRGENSSLLRLKVGGEQPRTVLIRQFQIDPVRRELMHVDFYGVSPREKLKSAVPLHFIGSAPVAESHDVTLVRAMDHVQVECFPGDLPRSVDVDLAALEELETTIRVRDLDVGEKVTILDHPEEVVVSVAPTAKETIETLEAEAEEDMAAREKLPEGAEEEVPQAAA